MILLSDSGDTALAATVTTKGAVISKVLGTILGFNVVITGKITTGGSTWKGVSNLVSQVTIKDAAHNVICQPQTSDFQDMAFWLNPKGIYVADTMLAASTVAVTSRFYLPFSVKPGDQPLSLQTAFNPYTSGEASASAGTGRVQIFGVFDDSAAIAANAQTQRVSKFAVTSVVGDNFMQSQLAKGQVTNALCFKISTEADLTSFTFSSAGQTEIDQITIDEATSLDNELLNSGHESTYFFVRASPFTCNDATNFDINSTTAALTLTVFQFYVT